MEKIKKLIPEKISVLGNQVVVQEKQFDKLVKTINLQTEVINSLLDVINAINIHIDENNSKVNRLQDSIQDLARALQTITED